jgi:hypothetical protein
MGSNKDNVALAATGVLAALACSAVHAQFGMVTLPSADFIWRWGENVEEAVARGITDFSARGNEAAFQCTLAGELRPGSQITSTEIHQMEIDLGVSLYFIQAAANAMNALDQRHELDWAELACVKPQLTDEDAQETAERVEKARQKAIDDMLKRREHRERE